jgi:hypothetical protein
MNNNAAEDPVNVEVSNNSRDSELLNKSKVGTIFTGTSAGFAKDHSGTESLRLKIERIGPKVENLYNLSTNEHTGTIFNVKVLILNENISAEGTTMIFFNKEKPFYLSIPREGAYGNVSYYIDQSGGRRKVRKTKMRSRRNRKTRRNMK